MNSTLTVAFFMIGNIIGSGFFMMPVLLAPIGLNLIFSWGVAFTLAMIFALIFGKLFVLFPESRVLSDYFKSIVAKKTVAIVYWISCIVGNSGLVVLFVSTLNLNVNPLVMGFITMFLLTFANHVLEYETIAKIEIVVSFIKFALLLLLPLFCVVFKPEVFVYFDFEGDIMQILRLGISCFWAFLGIEIAGVFGSGKSARNGLIIGVLACFVLYVFTSVLIVGSCVQSELMVSKAPFVLFFNNYFSSDIYQLLIGFLIAIAVVGALYGWIAATAKSALFYSESGAFPKIFEKSARSGNSILGLWLSSFATFLMFAYAMQLEAKDQFFFISDICVYMTLLLYMLCAYALLMNSKSISSIILGVLGIMSVLLVFAFDMKITFIALMTFLSVWVFLLYTNKSEKQL